MLYAAVSTKDGGGKATTAAHLATMLARTVVDASGRDSVGLRSLLLLVLATRVCEWAAYRRAISEGAIVQELGKDPAASHEMESLSCGGEPVKTKPSIDASLDGGAATDMASKAAAKSTRSANSPRSRSHSAAPAPGEFRKQMVMQLPVALINDLKRKALELSVSSGNRVTQQRLVEDALRKYLYK